LIGIVELIVLILSLKIEPIFSRPIITTVILSKDLLAADFLKINSTPSLIY
jgi:hypothetical protein